MASNMKIKKKSSEKTFDIINGAFLLILVILVAYPLYYVLIASISDPYEVYAGKTFLLPSKITFEGYKRVFKESSIAGDYLNSIYYTVLGTVVSVALVLTTGYCMSKKTLPFRRAIMIFYVIKFLGENPGACPWDEAKKYFSKSLMSISSEYTLQI